jgi:hypothetical protein
MEDGGGDRRLVVGARSSAREEARRTVWGCESCLEGGVNRQSNLKLT